MVAGSAFAWRLILHASYFGCAVVIAAVTLANLAALVKGLYYSIRQRRNLMPGSMQVASYLSCYLVLCAAFSALVGSLAYISTDWYLAKRLARFVHGDRDLVAFLIWFLITLVGLVEYFALVGRGTAATRYANR